MLSQTLIKELQLLSQPEKLQVIQLLANTLAAESFLDANIQYEVWSPYDSADVAHKLMQLIDKHS